MFDNNGWISLHRAMMDNPLWLSEPFTKAQAWIDLLMLARHKKTPELFFIRGNEVRVEYAEIARAESTFCDRWKWSRSKLRNFFKYLEKEQQIKIIKTPAINKLAIVNFEKYQEAIQQKDYRKTTERRQKDLNNNVNNDNNVNNNIITRINSSNNIIRESDFLRFWELYPKKLNQIHTRKLFNYVLDDNQATIMELLEGVQAYADAMAETENKYIMTPDRWLERSCWSNTAKQYASNSGDVDVYSDLIKQYNQKNGDDNETND